MIRCFLGLSEATNKVVRLWGARSVRPSSFGFPENDPTGESCSWPGPHFVWKRNRSGDSIHKDQRLIQVN